MRTDTDSNIISTSSGAVQYRCAHHVITRNDGARYSAPDADDRGITAIPVRSAMTAHRKKSSKNGYSRKNTGAGCELKSIVTGTGKRNNGEKIMSKNQNNGVIEAENISLMREQNALLKRQIAVQRNTFNLLTRIEIVLTSTMHTIQHKDGLPKTIDKD